MQRQRFIAGLCCAGTALFGARSAAFGFENAAPTVRVRLFAGDELDRADVGGVHLDSSSPPTEIKANSGALHVTAYRVDGTKIDRNYDGVIRSSVDGASSFALVNEVDLESYVASVLASEISWRWHPETLKAQAIAVRTYALRRLARKNAAYDVVDTTANQVYRGVDGIVGALIAAANATAGQALTFAAAPADVWYHSACGGHTAASTEVTGAPAPPYLGGIQDSDSSGVAYCSQTPYFTWRNTLAPSALARVVGLDASSFDAITIAARWTDGRARTVRIRFKDVTMRDVDGHAFYARAGSELGYKVVP
ncbi:MAG TPA: SpoIID/LytB domain-containing protein, partial [Mycobacteriales bacterium]|nr:SpoIID/LytB domain-containing protein [Mycobacteriales bacterium]